MKAGFIFITAGTLHVSANGTRHTLTQGDALIVSPLFVLTDFRESSDFRCERILLDIHDFLEYARKVFDTAFLPFIYRNPVVCLRPQEQSSLTARINAIHHTQERAKDDALPPNIQRLQTIAAELSTKALIAEFLAKVFHDNRHHITAHNDRKDRNIITLTRFLLMLNRQFATSRTVAHYAALCNLSTGRFSAIVREATGYPPMHWITTVTINNAKILLRQNAGMTIKEIARHLGFPEQYTFRKYFKQHTGISPTQYRAGAGQ
ncbi:MAG: helix-turn-helix domain-containing protein [Bacteroidaceae bacterium]|nr:helix-turn-helix domain-containing protein [Bacteroidaceae bacterium]